MSRDALIVTPGEYCLSEVDGYGLASSYVDHGKCLGCRHCGLVEAKNIADSNFDVTHPYIPALAPLAAYELYFLASMGQSKPPESIVFAGIAGDTFAAVTDLDSCNSGELLGETSSHARSSNQYVERTLLLFSRLETVREIKIITNGVFLDPFQLANVLAIFGSSNKELTVIISWDNEKMIARHRSVQETDDVADVLLRGGVLSDVLGAGLFYNQGLKRAELLRQISGRQTPFNFRFNYHVNMDVILRHSANRDPSETIKELEKLLRNSTGIPFNVSPIVDIHQGGISNREFFQREQNPKLNPPSVFTSQYLVDPKVRQEAFPWIREDRIRNRNYVFALHLADTFGDSLIARDEIFAGLTPSVGKTLFSQSESLLHGDRLYAYRYGLRGLDPSFLVVNGRIFIEEDGVCINNQERENPRLGLVCPFDNLDAKIAKELGFSMLNTKRIREGFLPAMCLEECYPEYEELIRSWRSAEIGADGRLNYGYGLAFEYLGDYTKRLQELFRRFGL